MGKRYTDGMILIDIETTGLDELKGYILEFGMAYYDKDFNYRRGIATLVSTPESMKYIEYDWERDEPEAYEMHKKSDLLRDQILWGEPTEELSPTAVARRAIDFIDNVVGIPKDIRPVITGSSVHFDLRWITRHMPELAARISYRTIDASSTRELMYVHYPELAQKIDDMLSPKEHHRVMEDIDDTVELLIAQKKYMRIGH